VFYRRILKNARLEEHHRRWKVVGREWFE